MDTIDVNKKILSDFKELEVTNEMIVPDVKPDIVNIIDTNGLAYVSKKEITNGSFKLNGNIDGLVVYLSSEGTTRSLGVNLDFNFKQEEAEIKEDCKMKYDIQVKEISSKMLNERKISVTTKLRINYKIYEKQEVKFYNSFENIEDLQKEEETLNINSVIGYGETLTEINEKTEVDNLDVISEILKVDASISNIESKMSYNKVLAKAEADVSIIYETEDGRIGKTSGKYPVMSFVEIPNAKETSSCELDYKMKNMALKINNGDEHYISINSSFEIQAQVFEEKQINIVDDLYSLKYDLDYTKNEIELELADNSDGDNIKIEEKFDVTEEIKNILDVDCKIDISNSNSPVAKIKAYGDSKDGLIIKEFEVPVMAKIEENKEYQVKNISKEFSLEENKLTVQSEFNIKQESSSFKKISMIQDVKTSENTETKENYSVVVYFVKPDDTIWKIAKKFKVSKDAIIRINNLENPDLIYPGDKIYVLK